MRPLFYKCAHRFLRPVEIGVLLALDAHVVYVADAPGAQHLTVRVDVDAIPLGDPDRRAPCNTAYFVFAADAEPVSDR